LAAHAQAELEHLKSLPPTSHKWTWGVDITENDVLASNQKTKGKGKSHHSGYVRSLPHGVYKKEWSITASIPTVSAAYSRPPTVTGIDAGLYFSDAESSHADTESNAAPAPAADVNMTASDASMAWQGEQPTAFQAAIVWQGDNDHDDSSPHMASPTALMPLPFSLPIPPRHLHPHIQPLFPQHQMQLIFSFHLRIPIRLDLMTLMPMPMLMPILMPSPMWRTI
jgi:hypothetical protein